jgi:spermidine synthase
LTAAGLAGCAVMMLEILGGRLLAPYFGYSIYQWGALIGVVMAALALGYWWGGRIGDRETGLQWLTGALAVACLATLLVPWTAPMLLPRLAGMGAAWGPVAATALLIAPPCLLLAITGPVLIGALIRTRAAAVAGRVYAVSTLGSIAGTFFTAFWAIPEIGTRASLLAAAGLAALATALVGWSGRRRAAAAFIALPLLAALVLPSGRAADTVYAAESPHNQIEVVDDADERMLYLNYRTGFQSIRVKGALLTDAAHDQFLLLPLFAPTKRLLFLGVAGGVSLNQLLTVYPALSLVGVELDPAVLQVAHQWFDLAESPRLELVADDARRFLATTDGRFDAAAIDLYVTGQVPPHCITVEFFRELRARLGENGVVMLNVVARHDPEVLVQPLAATLGRVFPSVYHYAPRNQIMIATARPTTAEALIRRLRGREVPKEIRPLAEAAARSLVAVVPPSSTPVFTDDKSDVELRSFHVVHGG